jgi:hypothetical protein
MTSHHPADIETNHESNLESYVETFYQHGRWHTRRRECGQPFASGPSREQMIALGAEVARWNLLQHVIRNTDGTIAEMTPPPPSGRGASPASGSLVRDTVGSDATGPNTLAGSPPTNVPEVARSNESVNGSVNADKPNMPDVTRQTAATSTF